MSISPLDGGAGTTIAVSGVGMPPRSGVLLILFYANDDRCELGDAGGGDHFLGIVMSDDTGSYRLRYVMPRTFDPFRGRDEVPPGGYALPSGNYYPLAFPCPSRTRDCFEGFHTGTDIGRPFVFSAAG